MKKIIVESLEPVRLDRYIRRVFPSATQGVIERYLRSGKIKVNESKAKSKQTVSHLLTVYRTPRGKQTNQEYRWDNKV